MYEPFTIAPIDIYHIVLAACTAIITISGATIVLIKAVNKFRSPNKTQDARLDKVEDKIEKIEDRLEKGNIKFESEDAKLVELENTLSVSTQIIIRSLQALTAHALDGNNIEELRDSKRKLDAYLIDKI